MAWSRVRTTRYNRLIARLANYHEDVAGAAEDQCPPPGSFPSARDGSREMRACSGSPWLLLPPAGSVRAHVPLERWVRVTRIRVTLPCPQAAAHRRGPGLVLVALRQGGENERAAGLTPATASTAGPPIRLLLRKKGSCESAIRIGKRLIGEAGNLLSPKADLASPFAP